MNSSNPAGAEMITRISLDMRELQSIGYEMSVTFCYRHYCPSVAAYHRGNGIDVGVQWKRCLLVLSQVIGHCQRPSGMALPPVICRERFPYTAMTRRPGRDHR
jgi:hypothetical protein